jgi:hypothetical protein
LFSRSFDTHKLSCCVVFSPHIHTHTHTHTHTQQTQRERERERKNEKENPLFEKKSLYFKRIKCFNISEYK